MEDGSKPRNLENRTLDLIPNFKHAKLEWERVVL